MNKPKIPTPIPVLDPGMLAMMGRYIGKSNEQQQADALSKDFAEAMKAAGPKPALKKKPKRR